MKRFATVAVLLIAIVALADEKNAPGRKLEGVVADSSNVLQAEAELALSWKWEGGKATPTAGIKSDAKGHFEHSFKSWPGNLLVLTYDKEREHGGLLNITDELSKKPVTVRLGPLVKVKGKVVAANPAAPLPADVNFTIATQEGNVDVLQVKAADGALALRMPPGKFKLKWAHEGFKAIEQDFETGPRAELDLGTIKAEPTPIAVGLGKTLPPFNAAFVRGGKPDLQIADYKGKWVLVLFWGSWCDTSSTMWIPNLITFDKRLKGVYDNYQILAYHDATAKSFQEMEEKLAKHGDCHWNPHDIPFPLLLDAQENGTVKSWGVAGEPIAMLFDTEGRYVKMARDYAMLEHALQDEKK